MSTENLSHRILEKVKPLDLRDTSLPQDIQEKFQQYLTHIHTMDESEALENYLQKKEQELQQLYAQRSAMECPQSEKKRIDIEIKCLLKSIEVRLDPEPVEFVNRLDERRSIAATNQRVCPYLLISAPSGYGKTRLLDVIREQLEYEGWAGIHLTLNPQKSLKKAYSADLSNPGEDIEGKIAHHLSENHLTRSETRGVLLTIDDVEVLTGDTGKVLFDEFFPTLYRKLKEVMRADQGLRIILAGRYITDLENISENGMQFEVMTLKPFTLSTVQQTVKNFVEKKHPNLSDAYIQELASHVMYLTGGHPKAMANILKHHPFPVSPAYLLHEEQQYYKDFLQEIIMNIQDYIGDDLFTILSRLSVVRRFNTEFLEVLIQNKQLTWSKSADHLESTLTNTYLVDREDTGFLKDAITQRLLSIRLRRDNLALFKSICQLAIEFYSSELDTPTIYRPDIYAVELVFQTLQLFFCQQYDDKNIFFQQVSGILAKLIKGREVSRRQLYNGFKTLLKNDWELRFNINYLLCQRRYTGEQTFNELLKDLDNAYEALK